jgi:hypothetical protein
MMATYHGLLHDWKEQSASHPINAMAYTPAGILSMQTNGDAAIIDLAPLNTLSAESRAHERGRLIEDAAMIGLRLTAAAVDDHGAYHWRATIERGQA